MQIHCPNCNYTGPAKKIKPGFLAVELSLYAFLILPGVAYSIWRRAAAKPVCPKCGWEHVVRKKE